MTPAPPPPTSTASSTERWFWPLLALITVGAWVLRVSPFFRVDGVLGWPVDYDEGVYVSASALFWRGVKPYSEFVFVHPPGAPLLLGAFTAWPIAPSAMLSAARVAMTVVGALNVLLAGVLVRRHAGLVGGLFAAVLYAVCPQAVFAERGVFLEPWLNLCCLGLLLVWTSRPRALAGGALLGVALLIKSWGVFWLLSVLISSRSRLAWLAAGVGVAVFGLVAAPFIFGSGYSFFEQVMLFHLWRPPDGTAERTVRLTEMFLGPNKALTACLVIGALGLWRERLRLVVQLLFVAFALIVLAFLASAAWWSQYDSHLTLVMALLAGLGCGFTWESVRKVRAPAAGSMRASERAPVLAVVVLGVLAMVPGLRTVIEQRRSREPAQLERATLARAAGTKRACAFEAFDLVRADLLPMKGTSPALVDSYAQMLLDATRGGERFLWVTAAFSSEPAQLTARAQLNECELVVRGWRGQWQLNDASRGMFDARFSPVGEGVFSVRQSPAPVR